MSRHDNRVTAVVHETAVVIGGLLKTGSSRASVVDGQMLIDFLQGRPSPNLSRRLDPSLRRFARDLVRGLGEAQLDLDVVQQTWLDLLIHTSRIDPLKSGSGFARWMLHSYALREVLSSCSPPGCKKRPTREERNRPVAPVSLEELSENGQEPPETSVSEHSMLSRIEADEFLRLAARTAPWFVSVALALIYLDGSSLREAAGQVGVTHPRLRRAIDRWAAEQRLSAIPKPKAVTVMGQSVSKEQPVPQGARRVGLRRVA